MFVDGIDRFDINQVSTMGLSIDKLTTNLVALKLFADIMLFKMMFPFTPAKPNSSLKSFTFDT